MVILMDLNREKLLAELQALQRTQKSDFKDDLLLPDGFLESLDSSSTKPPGVSLSGALSSTTLASQKSTGRLWALSQLETSLSASLPQMNAHKIDPKDTVYSRLFQWRGALLFGR